MWIAAARRALSVWEWRPLRWDNYCSINYVRSWKLRVGRSTTTCTRFSRRRMWLLHFSTKECKELVGWVMTCTSSQTPKAIMHRSIINTNYKLCFSLYSFFKCCCCISISVMHIYWVNHCSIFCQWCLLWLFQSSGPNTTSDRNGS
jgi:hypothetical protein